MWATLKYVCVAETAICPLKKGALPGYSHNLTFSLLFFFFTIHHALALFFGCRSYASVVRQAGARVCVVVSGEKSLLVQS